jgi:hypothetical protein
MKMDKDKTIVVFRTWNDGGHDVIALFPEVAGDNDGYMCNSYMHIGQHGAADWQIVYRQTRLAKPKEYQALKKELRKLGYRLVIKKRISYKIHKAKRDEARKSLLELQTG